MRKRLTRNLGLKIASLLLACILWFVVAQIGDPKDTKSFSNIPVNLTNTELLDAENKVYEILDDTDVVRVTVSAPRSIINNLHSTDIVAEADMSKLTDINTIAIKYSIQNAEVDSVEGDHESVRLSVEEKKTKWVRVEHGTIGEPAEGYVVYSDTPDQTMIEISGPDSLISQVSYAKVQLDVTGATANMSANVLVELFDKENRVVNQKAIKKNTDQIQLHVEILSTKEVDVEVQVGGEPAPGYAFSGDVTSSIEKVMLAGNKSQLNSISKIVIPSENVDITGLSESLEQTMDLKDYLPENIRFAENRATTKTKVFVGIEPILEKTVLVPAQNISIRGSIQGKVTILNMDISQYELELSGLQRNLDVVKGANIMAYIDVDAWAKLQGAGEIRDGVYDLPITFETPDNLSALNSVTAKVRINNVDSEE